MNKIVKIILLAASCYVACFIYKMIMYGHSHDWETCKQYMWIFKDHIIKDLKGPYDYFACSSSVKKRDINNVFRYHLNNEVYPVTVWEFKDLANVDLNKITINRNIDFGDIKFRFGEILNSEGSFPITINYGFAFHNAMNVNLNCFSKIDGVFNGPNYKGFYGTIDKMSFSDEKGKHQIVFNYSAKANKASFSPSVFLLYKGHQSFYVIIINSKKLFKDANIINILNLQE